MLKGRGKKAALGLLTRQPWVLIPPNNFLMNFWAQRNSEHRLNIPPEKNLSNSWVTWDLSSRRLFRKVEIVLDWTFSRLQPSLHPTRRNTNNIKRPSLEAPSLYLKKKDFFSKLSVMLLPFFCNWGSNKTDLDSAARVATAADFDHATSRRGCW